MQKNTSKASRSRANQYKMLILPVLIILAGLVTPRVFADRFDQQINTLQQQNSQSQQTINKLQLDATGIEDQVARLNQQIAGFQDEIQSNQNKMSALENQIQNVEAELALQKTTLGESIKSQYVSSNLSTIEMLATSKDLSDFIDQQTYQNTVQQNITGVVLKISELRSQLSSQKELVEVMIKEKQVIQSQIQDQKAEQDRLLGLNQAERSAVDQQIKGNSVKITELKRQQALQNVSLFGAGGGSSGSGGYPWANATCMHTGQVDGGCWNYDWAVNGSVWNWQTGGYGYRNCTDWVSYRLKTDGKRVPSGLGNANTWDDIGASYGFSVSSTPSVGSAAVSNIGTYGHLMYVERVNDNGSIFISDYNRAGTGRYGTSTLSASVAWQLRYVNF